MKKYIILILFLLSVSVAALACCTAGNKTEDNAADKKYFTVSYFCNGEKLFSQQVQDGSLIEPVKLGDSADYIFNCWMDGDTPYNFYQPMTSNLNLYASRTAVEHTVTFYADGILVARKTFTANDKEVELPEVPAKQFYTNGVWEQFELKSCDFTVNAEYTPVEYTADFYANGELIKSVPYTVESAYIAEPVPPVINGYTASWESYELAGGGITINAVYTPVSYSVYFYADGLLINTVLYNMQSVTVTCPEVPQKDGYSGQWENFVLSGGDIAVNAVYTKNRPPVEKPPETENPDEQEKDPPENNPEIPDEERQGTEGLQYILKESGYGICGYSGTDTSIVIPSVYNGKPVITVETSAFAFNNTVKEIYICNGVKSIGGAAFQRCTELEKITLPNSIDTIGDSAFACCVIKEIVLPENLKILPKNIFNQCIYLERVILPDGLLKIDVLAFGRCIRLKEITFGASLVQINELAFKECLSLTSAVFTDCVNWRNKNGKDISQMISSPQRAAEILLELLELFKLIT